MINLCMVLDDRYSKMARRCIHDIMIRQNPDTETTIYILGDNLSKEAVRDISIASSRCKIMLFSVSSNDIPISSPNGAFSYLNKTIYLKFLIPEILKNTGIDRVLYIDVDMLCRRDLTDLYNYDIQGKAIGAVKDQFYIFNNIKTVR